MGPFWLLPLLLFLAACNVANTPPAKVSSTGVVDTSVRASFTSLTQYRLESAGSVIIPLVLSEAFDTATTVSYSLTGSATGGAAPCSAGEDYLDPSGTVTFAAGATTATIPITLCLDSPYEGNETIILTLTGTDTDVKVGDPASTTVYIQDSAIPPRISFDVASSGSIAEGAAGTTVVPVDIELANASFETVNVKVGLSGTATEGVDYDIDTTSVSFAPGSTTATVNVTIYGDGTIEPNETVVLNLYDPENGAIGTQATHQIQITQDEVPNQVTAAIAALGAQAEAAGVVNVTVNLTGVTDHAVLLYYSVDFGAAIAATQRAELPADFTLTGFDGSVGSVVIPANAASVTIPVTIAQDALFEPTEGFVLQLLGGPEVAVDAGFESTEVQITDDDTPPLVGFTVAAQTRSESVTTAYATIRLYHPTLAGVSQASGEDVEVTLATANGTTEGASDWTMTMATVTIPAGQTQVSVPIGLIQDGVDEDDESFTLSLTPPAGYTAASNDDHVVTILDADPAVRVAFEATSSTVAEAAPGAISINLTLDGASERDVVVGYTVTGASTSSAACGTQDIQDTNSGSVTIPGGSVMPFAIPNLTLCADALYEGDETAVFKITSATKASLGSILTHSLEITEDDAAPDVSIAAASADYEEVLQTAGYVITVQPTAKPFSLTYAVTGTSSVGLDHTLSASGVVNVAASTGVQNIPLNFSIIDDTSPEDAETVIVTISATSVDANVVTAADTITIRANDILQLALGYRHTCGLLSGVVKCWGYGPVLGQGTTSDYGDDPGELVSALSAVDLGAGFNATKVVAGRDFSCALSAAGTVKCWGDNTYGQLGLDRAASGAYAIVGDSSGEMGSNLPTVPLGAVIVDIAASSMSMHVCALTSSGRMKCWGRNEEGQLGLAFSGATCNDTTPNTLCQGDDFGEVAGMDYLAFPDAGVTVERIAVGSNHSCAQTSNDKVFCWGDNTDGALGVDSNDANRYLHTVPYASAVAFNAAFDVSTMTGLSAQSQRTCAEFTVAGADSAVCWGNGDEGELGQGNTDNAGTAADTLAAVAAPIDLSVTGGTFTTITGLRMGGSHSCARGEDDEVVCWGSNALDALGSGGGADVSDLSTATLLTPYTDVYAGSAHTCAVSGAFQYTCWGDNTNGRTGTQADAVDAPPAVRDFQ